MKKAITIVSFRLVLLTILAFWVGCDRTDGPDTPDNPDDPDKPPVVVIDSLGVSVTTINFTAEQDASLIVVRTNTSWSAVSSAAWISLSAGSGTKNTGFLIGAPDNEGFRREATVTLTAGDKTQLIEITQAGASTIHMSVKGVPLTLVLVEGDQFTMGSSDPSNASLQHQVKLSDFYISTTEITNAMWQAVVNSLPYEPGSGSESGNNPVSSTSWNAVTSQFLPALNQLTGKSFRLPTEAEWEFAAMGGKEHKGYTYAGSNTLDEVGWYRTNAAQVKQKVAQKLPNELGIYDMSGNVNEWCNDWFDTYFGFELQNQSVVIPDLQTNPSGPATGTQKVVRGGNVESVEQWGFSDCNVKFRKGIHPSGTDQQPGYSELAYLIENTGFRIVLPL